MPTLNWLNRHEALTLATNASYRLLQPIPELSYSSLETENMLIQGDNLVGNPDTDQKQNVGELWEEEGHGQGLFLMAVKRDVKGQDVHGQIERKIEAESFRKDMTP